MTIETAVGPVNVLHRLALGVECVDALTERLITSPVRAGREVPDPPRTRGTVERRPCVDLERANSGRFRLRHGPGVPTRFVLRLDDLTGRVVPRRLAVQLFTAAEVGETARGHVPVRLRVVRPWLLPGPVYEPSGGITAIRGRVARRGVGVRWARVVASTDSGVVAGRAHADERGEFLLVVTDVDQDDGVQSTVAVGLVASARDPRRPVPVDPADRCADLVVEPVPRPALPPAPPPPVADSDLLRGVDLPPGYVTSLAAPLRQVIPVGAVTAMTTDVEFVALP
jgi:hypothetical protein